MSVVPLDSEVSVADNRASTDVEVIDKVSSVLLFAGGPNREFRFLRNQLFRDPKIKVDVLLQTADDGADQEGDNLLTRFPKMESELFGYDCIIAFDPDWSQLSSEQTELVRRWVADEAGGLVVVAGPVNTPIWTSRPNDDNVIDPIRKLYPVQFYSQASGSIKLGRFGGTEAFPLEFTNVASSLEFLRFAEANEQNDEIWKKVKVFRFLCSKMTRNREPKSLPTSLILQLAIRVSRQFIWRANFTVAAGFSFRRVERCGGPEASVRNFSKRITLV